MGHGRPKHARKSPRTSGLRGTAMAHGRGGKILIPQIARAIDRAGRALRGGSRPMTARLLPGLLVAATVASAQSSGHFDLEVRKSGVLRLGKSHIDPVSAWVTHTDEF